MKLPKHYRKLSIDEDILPTDLFENTSGTLSRFGLNGYRVRQFHHSCVFYRRKHIKTNSKVRVVRAKEGALQVVERKSKQPVIVVEFVYKKRPRSIKVTGFDNKYLTGFEGKQFKKFRRDRLQSPVMLLSI